MENTAALPRIGMGKREELAAEHNSLVDKANNEVGKGEVGNGGQEDIKNNVINHLTKQSCGERGWSDNNDGYYWELDKYCENANKSEHLILI